jgi:hypothetical protein
MALFGSSKKIPGKIIEAKRYKGDVIVEVLLANKMIERVFTKDVELEKLKMKDIHLVVPVIETKSKVEEALKERKLKELEAKKGIREVNKGIQEDKIKELERMIKEQKLRKKEA